MTEGTPVTDGAAEGTPDGACRGIARSEDPDLAQPVPRVPAAPGDAPLGEGGAEGPAEVVPTPAPRRSRRWALWTALAAVVVLLACGLPAALVAGERGSTGPAVAAVEPATVVARQFAERVDAQLDRQSAALLRGDRAGWLAVAEPGVHAELRRRFAALRALRVTGWQARPDGLPTPVEGRPGEWRVMVEFRYCFAVPDCRTSPVLTATRWRDATQPRLLAVEPSASRSAGTRPWEVSDLVVAVGERTVVATTPAQRKRLPDLLARAESAARIADTYAVDGRTPDRYRIFHAGPAEWKRWYGGGRPRWTAGYAVTVGGGHHEVVLNADSVTGTGLDDLLRHELTHAATMPDVGYPGARAWWLVEGLAEYAGVDGRPVERYDGLADVRRLVTGDWSGRLDRLAPAGSAPADRVSGSYGVAYLAVQHLVDRFGIERLLALFRVVAHEGRSLDEAADEVFDTPWSVLHDECVAYARSLTG
ncbi:hypothetical protein [Micromonospora thermarum]|uniref:hypothetical protein n=1 Tax=Micromonospora thermarum TaxID=2720024 RepID=UPI0028163DC4|nr:hypothetical protein [Micromonospora thermarum]